MPFPTDIEPPAHDCFGHFLSRCQTLLGGDIRGVRKGSALWAVATHDCLLGRSPFECSVPCLLGVAEAEGARLGRGYAVRRRVLHLGIEPVPPPAPVALNVLVLV